MFEEGFPKALRHDVQAVAAKLPLHTYNQIKIAQSEQFSHWRLASGEGIRFPYRIYYQDPWDTLQGNTTPTQQLIYHCIFSRSCNGFVREKHIKSILSQPFPLWAAPYLVKICDEYVVEILETVYAGLNNTSTQEIKAMCKNNLTTFLTGHNRMISYWNEYYRQRYPRYRDYIGRRLYDDHFGYTRGMERLQTPQGPRPV